MLRCTRPVLLIASVLVVVSLASPGYAAVQKVDVCHHNDTGAYHLITVAAKAVPAHRAHGDALPYDAVPDNPGYTFDATCQEVAASTCPCDLSLDTFATYGIDRDSIGKEAPVGSLLDDSGVLLAVRGTIDPPDSWGLFFFVTTDCQGFCSALRHAWDPDSPDCQQLCGSSAGGLCFIADLNLNIQEHHSAIPEDQAQACWDDGRELYIDLFRP